MIEKQGNKIILTKDDADTYREFIKNRDKFTTMNSAGLFDLEYGKIEINLHNGQIQSIHIHKMLYKRSSNSDTI